MTDDVTRPTTQQTAALMANFRTRNLGNLALTTVTQELVVECYGRSQVRSVHRAPHALADLVTDAPVDQWAPRLTKRMGTIRPLANNTSPLRTPGISQKGAEVMVEPLWRRPLVAAGHSRIGLEVRARRATAAARHHYESLLGADDLIWIPGGEISTLTHPRNRLLDVEIALSEGRRVAMANFSFEPSPATAKAFRSLIPRLHRILPRDEVSYERLLAMGADAERVTIVPDAVFMMGSGLVPSFESDPAGPKRDVVGIVLHGLTPLPKDEWRRVLKGIQELGLGIEVISSHLEFDHEVIASLLEVADGDVEVLPEFTTVSSYIAHLQTLRGLVTARFHSAVMGIISGITVAGVDSYGGKVKGALATAGLAEAAASGPGWPDRAVEIISSGDVVDRRRLAACRERIRAGYAAAFPMPATS